MIHITENAKRKLTAVLHTRGDEKAVHLSIQGRGPDGFDYKFQLIDRDEVDTRDHVIEEEGFTLFLAHEDLDKLDGATLDFYGLGAKGSFRVENPHSAWDSPLASAVHEVITKQINPGVAAHGGYVTLVDVKGEDIYIEFGGGCMGCGASQVTLKMGIERLIREAVPQVGQIIDATDHAAGENPYYAPEAEGDSPLAK